MFENLMNSISSIWNDELFKLGDASLTLGTVFYFFASIILLFYLTGKLKYILVKKVFVRYNIDVGVSQSIGTIIKYVLLIVGFIIIIQSTGIDLSALGILVGALGIGIGLGLQNITNNFISGIIILFERPVKVGDRIEVDDVTGMIVSIGARATTIITNDNIAIIIPNSDLISSKVINWNLYDRRVRFNFPVRASYKEDPEKIKAILLDVAKSNQGIIDSPKPDVLFDEFGEDGLKFILRVWTIQLSDTPKVLKSQLYYAISKKFKEHNIEVPFPQRDLHIKSSGEESKTLLFKAPE